MRNAHDIIRRPLMTEHSSMLMEEQKKYTFEVLPDANKVEIKQAIEELFNVKVQAVNTMNVPGKLRRYGAFVGHKPSWKKAIVTLTPDSKPIPMVEGF
jgi:large subunit ribosomal protein L23